MGFFGKLFGSEKALSGIVNGVTNGLDKLVYTDEEKAGDAAKDRTEARQMVVQWMTATQGQNLARRLIALSITGVWLLQYVAAQFFGLVSVWSSKPENWQGSAKVMTEGAGQMNSAVMLILAFYFAAPHMGDIAKAVTSKFTRNVNGLT